MDWETGNVDDWHITGDLQPIAPEAAAAEFGFENAEALPKKISDEYPYIIEGDVMASRHFPEGDASAQPAPRAGA
jgi:hypothetical protein